MAQFKYVPIDGSVAEEEKNREKNMNSNVFL